MNKDYGPIIDFEDTLYKLKILSYNLYYTDKWCSELLAYWKKHL